MKTQKTQAVESATESVGVTETQKTVTGVVVYGGLGNLEVKYSDGTSETMYNKHNKSRVDFYGPEKNKDFEKEALN